MSNQIVISSGAKVRELEGVLTGTAGIVNALGINVPSGIPQLDGSGKILVSQLPNSIMEYKGSWNAATNTPTLVNGTGNAGDVYLCEVAGTVNFGAGPITFAVGDQVIYSGSIWQRASGATGTVTSVAVTESGDALTITGSPITTSGTINIGFAGTSGQYINGAGGLTTFPSLTGFVPYTGATAALDMGNNSITTSNFIFGKAIELDAGVEEVGGRVIFRQRAATSGGGANYTTFGAQSNNNVNFSFWQDAPSGINRYKFFTFSVDNLTLNVNRTYQMPDLSGTLALLEGAQTFTGAKTFSSNINADSGIRLKNGVAPSANGYVGIGSNTQGLTLGIYDSGSVYYQELYFPYTNGYQYTFPAATGTLALTSDLSSYVPYTGATSAVDLGSFGLTAVGVTANSFYARGVGSQGGYLYLKQGTTPYSTLTGASSISADGTKYIFFSDAGSSNGKIALFELGSLSNNTNRTFTLPDLSGTLALLEGSQTFTGLKTFSNNVNINQQLFINGGTGYGGGVSYRQGGILSTSDGSTTTEFPDANSIKYYVGQGSNNYKNFVFDVNFITLNATRTYNLPDASGTLALTSNLSSYVPYTGATANVNLGTFDLTADVITGATGSFASSGGSDTFAINHSSGSGIALNITKGGNGEGLYINKTSGSGNALTVIGSTSLGALSGTSATFSSSVGINGVSATYPLYVRTGTNQRARFVDNGGLFQMAVLNDAESGYSDMSLGNSAIVIKSVGNVGIGTSSPSERLMLGNGGAIAFTNSSDAKKWHIQYNSNDGLNFVESDVADFRLFLKAGGNVGIGVVPSAWNSASRALQLPSFVSLSHQNSGALNLMSYAYESSANVFTYAATGVYATRLYMDPNDGVISFFNSATGTAGNTITFNERFRVNPNGIITIPNLAAAGSRAVIADSSGNLSAPVSDISVKENIKTIGYGLNEILKMNPVWFDFINEYKNYGEGRQNGNIAQEMELIIPEAVFTTPTTGKMGINYDQLHAVYIKAIQEQQAQIEELKAKIK
jgi:hypothetical protein